MTKVFVLNVDSYNEFGQHLGTNVVGVYTTRELAQQVIDNAPNITMTLKALKNMLLPLMV
jgi:hypothetical protein